MNLKSINYLNKILFICLRINLGIKRRWRKYCSNFIKLQMKRADGNIYFGNSSILKGMNYVTCLGNFQALDRTRIEAIDRHGDQIFNPVIIFGKNVSMEYDCHIGAVNRIEIHDNVLIGSRVYISDHSHGGTSNSELLTPPNCRKIYSKGAVIIQENVWIGEGVAILPGVIIGQNSIIGANSVVTKNIPSFSIAVGSPAKIINQ